MSNNDERKSCPIHAVTGSFSGPQASDGTMPLSFREILEAAPDPMVLVDRNGIITLVNSQTEKVFGFTKSELVGQAVEILLPQALRERHIGHRESYGQAPRIREMGAGLELRGRRKDGTEFPVEISLSPLVTQDGPIVVSAIRDTTSRHKAEQKLLSSLREKEVLLKEVHHRVKNNLQIISSLLNFQSDLITDPRARDAFQDTRSRIKSIALLHERLYQSEDLSHIDFADYIAGLMDNLYDTFGVERDRIMLVTEIERVVLDVDTVVNCGLIVNELTSNALKYAFPKAARGTVTVILKREGSSELRLAVRDSGIGLPAGDDFLSGPTLGLKLVRGLTRELGGTLTIEREPHTLFQVCFPIRDPRHEK